MTEEVYKAALPAIAGVGAVFWTGGLIVLQLKAAMADGGDSHNSTNVGMAFAAFGALVPLLGCVSQGCTMRAAAFIVALYYLLLTIRNFVDITEGIATGNYARVKLAVGYLAPTAGLVVVMAFPLESVVAWSSVVFIFFSYVSLSSMSRIP